MGKWAQRRALGKEYASEVLRMTAQKLLADVDACNARRRINAENENGKIEMTLKNVKYGVI